jgi:predicted acetyltransferase
MATQEAVEISAPVDEAEMRSFRRLADHAFSSNPPPDPDLGYMHRQGVENFLLVRVRGRVAGGLGMIPMGQWFGGRSIPAAGINAVAIAPEHRSTGIGSRLLRHMLEEARARGFALSSLYPATQVVYRRAGYEQAGVHMRYKHPTHALPARDRSGVVRPVEESDQAAIRELYTERARRTAGNLDRTEMAWGRLQHPGDTMVCSYLVENQQGRAEGYVIYTQREGPGERDRNLHARDLVALTPEAGRRLLSFLADHRSTVDNVEWAGAPSEPLLFHVANQEYRVVGYEQWMLRLVDVRAALEARGYPEALSAELHLEVRDETLPWNEGRLVLALSGGRAEVRGGGEGRIKVDVRGLAPIYSGYLSPQEMRSTGLLEGPAADLAAMALVFGGPAPWMPDAF